MLKRLLVTLLGTLIGIIIMINFLAYLFRPPPTSPPGEEESAKFLTYVDGIKISIRHEQIRKTDNGYQTNYCITFHKNDGGSKVVMINDEGCDANNGLPIRGIDSLIETAKEILQTTKAK